MSDYKPTNFAVDLFHLNPDLTSETYNPTIWENNGKIFDLSLCFQNLRRIPSSIRRLSFLVYLDLSDNHLTFLPSSIGRLSRLEEFYLQRNHLTSLPSSIGRLSSLQNLLLRDNRLTFLPLSIVSLSSLRFLSLANNPLLDYEILEDTNTVFQPRSLLNICLDYINGICID